ncbi:MAG TPA: hypothetical protein VEZ72_19510, partial [Paenibacillus sp.]|nr:hypothetical protein [Paenibacillus sp.]
MALLLALSLFAGAAVPGAGAATASTNGGEPAPEPVTYRASAGFSGTQGGNGWHYWKQRGGVSSDLV